MSPFFKEEEDMFVISSLLSADGILCASTSFLEALNASAWAFPLPSAIASAKFAKTQVNHKITAMENVYPLDASFNPNNETIHNPVVRIADRYTSSMTGFCSCVFGFNFRNDSFIALPSIFLSAKALFVFDVIIVPP